MAMGFMLISIICLAVLHCQAREVLCNFTVSRFVSRPDGVAKEVIGINGQSPGPIIRVFQGDFVNVLVSNQLDRDEATSIHWHGILQTNNCINDGASWITQHPIPSGSSYAYRFKAEQAGTFWYHSHHMQQWSDGLYGILIVDDPPNAPKLYDAEILLILNENYHLSSPIIYSWYSAQNDNLRLPLAESVLINGKGSYPCEYAERQGLPCAQEEQVKYGEVRVRPGLIYRFRIISTSTINGYTFQIDDHNFQVLEQDGIPTAMTETYETLNIAPAQRVSLLVTMNHKSIQQFWIRFSIFTTTFRIYDLARPNLNQFPAVSQQIMKQFKIVLKYDTQAGFSNSKEVPPLQPAQPPYPTTKLKARRKEVNESAILPASSQPLLPFHTNETHTLVITDILGLKEGASGFNYIELNLKNVTEPALFAVAKGEKLLPQFNPIYIQGFGPDYVVELIVNNVAMSGHALHFHGHNMWMVGRGEGGDGLYDGDKWDSSLIKGGKAPLRDTFLTHFNSWIVLRFVANNPGTWLFHCHMEMHFGTGMGLVFVVGEKEIQQRFPIKS